MNRHSRTAILGLLVLCASAHAAGCATTTADVCDALNGFIKACNATFPAPQACMANLGSCSDEDLSRWYERYTCLEDHCRDGVDPTAADEACSAKLDGVSLGCNPLGAGG